MAVPAYPNPYKRIAASIATANSMDEVAKLLLDFPEAIKSRSVTNALMVEMSNILKRSSETVVSLPFMMAVIQCTQQYYTMGEPSDAITTDNHSVGLAGWQILQIYLRSLVDKDKDALKNPIHRNSKNKEFVRNCDVAAIRDDPFALVGIGFLMVNYTRWDTLDKAIHDGLKYAVKAYLKIMMDISVPSAEPSRVVQIVEKIWRQVDVEKKDGFCGMLRHWDGNMEMATNLADKYICEEPQYTTSDSELRSECMALMTQLANCARSTFVQETFFYEYIEMLRSYYPLNEKRDAIRDRYSKYFGEDDTNSYMVSLYSACMAAYGDMEVTPSVMTHDAIHHVNMEVERIVYHIYSMHPNVDWRVTQLFFRDVLECHGMYFKHYAESSVPYANCIVDAMEAAKRKIEETPDMNVAEAFESTLETLYAMEDEYGYPDFQDDFKGEKIDHSGNDAEEEKAANNVDTRDMHKTSTKNAWQKFQEKKPEIDAKINDVTMTIRKALAENKQAILINGQPKSVIWTVMKLYAGFGLFRASKTAFALMMVVNHYLKKGSRSQRIKLLQDVENELVMVEEKIQDAISDNNREAKYELMRSKQSLLEARKRLRYGVGKRVSGKTNLTSNRGGYTG